MKFDLQDFMQLDTDRLLTVNGGSSCSGSGSGYGSGYSSGYSSGYGSGSSSGSSSSSGGLSGTQVAAGVAEVVVGGVMMAGGVVQVAAAPETAGFTAISGVESFQAGAAVFAYGIGTLTGACSGNPIETISSCLTPTSASVAQQMQGCTSGYSYGGHC